MTLFLIGALRAVIEMLGLCLLGQGALALLAGRGRRGNPIYRLFDLITAPPRRLVEPLLPRRAGEPWIGLLCFLLLFLAWIGLAIVRKFI